MATFKRPTYTRVNWKGRPPAQELRQKARRHVHTMDMDARNNQVPVRYRAFFNEHGGYQVRALYLPIQLELDLQGGGHSWG